MTADPTAPRRADVVCDAIAAAFIILALLAARHATADLPAPTTRSLSRHRAGTDRPRRAFPERSLLPRRMGVVAVAGLDAALDRRPPEQRSRNSRARRSVAEPAGAAHVLPVGGAPGGPARCARRPHPVPVFHHRTGTQLGGGDLFALAVFGQLQRGPLLQRRLRGAIGGPAARDCARGDCRRPDGGDVPRSHRTRVDSGHHDVCAVVPPLAHAARERRRRAPLRVTLSRRHRAALPLSCHARCAARLPVRAGIEGRLRRDAAA